MRPLPASDHRAFVVDARGDFVGAALCLHGYSGTPYEVRPVAEGLADAGWSCSGPLLTGHGDDPAALNRTPWRAWLEDAVAAFDLLAARAPQGPRVVVGCSMGGLVALQLSLVRAVDALVLLAPALRFHPGGFVGVAGLAAGLWRLRPFLPKEAPGGDVGDVEAQRRNPTYKVLPTRGLVELLRLQLATERVLPRVRAPLCVLHGDRDGTIAPVSSEIVAAAVASDVVEHHRLPRSQHLIGLDVERDEVVDASLRFLRELRRLRAAGERS